MDNNTVLIVVIGLFALIAIAAFYAYRNRTKLGIKGPFGTGIELDATDQPDPDPPGVRVKNATSRKGGLLAEDRTGRGADVEGVEVQDDILVSSEGPAGGDPPKKA